MLRCGGPRARAQIYPDCVALHLDHLRHRVTGAEGAVPTVRATPQEHLTPLLGRPSKEVLTPELNRAGRFSSRSPKEGTVALARKTGIGETRAMRSHRYPRPRPTPSSVFAGYRFPPEVITLAVRWYLRFGLSYRDVEELLAERGVEVDHVTVYRWVQRFAPEFAEAARARQHIVGDSWHVDETYVRVGGTWRYLFRAIDQFGQVVDVYLSPRRDANAARRFFERAIGRTRIFPVEVKTLRKGLWNRLTTSGGVDPLTALAIAFACYPSDNPPHSLRPMVDAKRAWVSPRTTSIGRSPTSILAAVAYSA